MVNQIIERIISGGQTGADQGGLEFGLEAGIEIGGYCPKGFICENGKIPDTFPLQEVNSINYDERTILNIKISDGTIIFIGDNFMEKGTKITVHACIIHKKPYAIIEVKEFGFLEEEREHMLSWLLKHDIKVLNIAGNRESNCPGIQYLTRKILKFFFLQN